MHLPTLLIQQFDPKVAHAGLSHCGKALAGGLCVGVVHGRSPRPSRSTRCRSPLRSWSSTFSHLAADGMSAPTWRALFACQSTHAPVKQRHVLMDHDLHRSGWIDLSPALLELVPIEVATCRHAIKSSLPQVIHAQLVHRVERKVGDARWNTIATG